MPTLDLPRDATGEALRSLQAAGSDLTRPMEIDFFVAVPDAAAGERVAVAAGALGYRAKVEQDRESRAWTCYCTMTLVPGHAAVVRAEQALDAIGKSYGGHGDGFGSFGNAEKPAKPK